MPSKISPSKLTPLDFPPRPDPRSDWTADAEQIAQWLGVAELSPADYGRLGAGHRFSLACAEHFDVCCEQFLCHSKGRWAGDPLVWEQWQREQWTRPILGWYKPDGTRSINRVYIECGKKSGKSTYAAALQIYFCVFFGEPGAEVYSLASTLDQAAIVQGQAEDCIKASPQMEKRSNTTYHTRILWPQTDSVIAVASGRGRSGFNPFALVLDELHEWQGAESFEKWQYGSRARDNWLHFSITNAGDDEESVCYRQRQYCLKVMDGTIADTSYYGKVYSVSREEAEAEVEAVAEGATELPVARKTNPGLGSIVKEEDLLNDIRRALHIPSEMPNLLRFTYCIWRTAAALEWLERYWDDCQADYTLADLKEYPCWLGLDMSVVSDLTALVLVARVDDEVYRQWPFFWVPRLRAKELRKYTNIESWERDGYILVQPGEMIKAKPIKDLIVELCESHKIECLTYDPKEASLLTSELEEELGLNIFPFKQSHENYHEATDEYEGRVKAGLMEHPGHPILTWQAKHAKCGMTTWEHKKPLKPDPEAMPHKGVDGVQAAVMAFSQARLYEEEELLVGVLP